MFKQKDNIIQIEPWINIFDAIEVFKSVLSTYVTENSYTQRFEAEMAKVTGAKYTLAFNNGTSALYSILKRLNLTNKDEIIVPDITFISSATSVLWAGGCIRLCPINKDTLQIDDDELVRCINENTKAILAVPLYGYSPNYTKILEICEEYDLLLLEDAAQGMGVNFKGRHVGTFGKAGVISFYGNKTITTGQGGIVLTNDVDLLAHLKIFKNHGRETKGTFIHNHEGYNFCFTDMQGALGVSQLKKLRKIKSMKDRIYWKYVNLLQELNVPFEQIKVIDGVEPVYWFSTFRFKRAEGLACYLEKKGIGTRRLFLPLHRQPHFQGNNQLKMDFDYSTSDFAYAEYLSLPSSAKLSQRDLIRVCKEINDFYAKS